MEIPSIDYLLDETAKNSQSIWQVVLREEQTDSGESQDSILERALHTYEVMKNIILKTFDQVWEAAVRHGVSLRMASYVIALEKVCEAKRIRGIFP